MMIESVTNEETRFKFKDSFGNPYVFSWFIMDFVGFKTNPRKRPEGFHVVWNWYKDLLQNQEFNDGFYWHFHTVRCRGRGQNIILVGQTMTFMNRFFAGDCMSLVGSQRFLEQEATFKA